MTNFLRLLAVVFTFGFSFLAISQPAPQPLQEVEAKGSGSTGEEAFKQALLDAVRQVVGTLVSAENMVKNDALIKDEVLTLSNGFVEKVLNQDMRKQSDGTWMVTLKCVVRKGPLNSTLQDLQIPTKHFDGKSLAAEIHSKLNLKQEVSGMLKSACKELKPSQLVICSMVGDKPTIENLPGKSDPKAEVGVLIQIQAAIDLACFFNGAAPKLDQILSKLALAQSKDIKDGVRNKRMHGGELDKYYQPFSPSFLSGDPDLTTFTTKLEDHSFDIFGLPIRSNKDYSQWTYKVFALPTRVHRDFNEVLPRNGYIRIHFLRADESVVKEENVVSYQLGRIRQIRESEAFVPLFSGYSACNINRAQNASWGGALTPSFRVEYRTYLSGRQISEIKTVKITADDHKLDEK